MKTYYIFKINSYFAYVYQNKPYKMYKMLEELYHTKEYDIVLTYRMYEQLAIPFSKSKLNDFVSEVYKGCSNYYRNNNTHILNTTTSSSKLVIGGANLKIKSTVNYPTFFDVIMSYSDNLFVCDFINKDYFWLDKIRKNNCQKEFNIVQYQ